MRYMRSAKSYLKTDRQLILKILKYRETTIIPVRYWHKTNKQISGIKKSSVVDFIVYRKLYSDKGTFSMMWEIVY